MPSAEVAAARRARVEGHRRQPLTESWRAAAAPPDLHEHPSSTAGLEWLPAQVPGTAARVLREAGRWRPATPIPALDDEDWWFHTAFDAAPAGDGEEVVLALDGLATLAEVWLNGERLLESASMFAPHELPVGDRLRGANELVICCRALDPGLRQRRRPRARWRTRVVREGNLRFFRTMLLGRAPGFAPGPAAVGPWRPVRLERRRQLAVDALDLRPRLDGADGVLGVSALLRPLGGPEPSRAEVVLVGPSGTHRAELACTARGGRVAAEGELRVADVETWWPHTHGWPCLHEVGLRLGLGGREIAVGAGRVGFRDLRAGAAATFDADVDDLALRINGVPIFARGAVWTPADPVGLAPTDAELRAALEHVRDAGMNLLRVVGTAAYEDERFHDLCDELGILVWQDLMFANFDYPFGDDEFAAQCEREARGVVAGLAGRPSFAVLCGNSEVEQQAAMLGLAPGLGRAPFFGEVVPGLLRESGADAAYVPSAPCGGDLPFRPGTGVANYFGVGGYRRPVDDVRRAGVRFAAECLAFANVPDEEALAELLPDAPETLAVHHPAWKAGVPRDVGNGWDFDDVRDHYLELVFGEDPQELRRVDHERYLALSRELTGELMAEVFGEWRRTASPCAGGLVLWLRDLQAGAGWGVLDHRGRPKAAYHHLRRALAPVAVWTTDEGLGGIAIHAANDRPEALDAHLRVALYRDGERIVEQSGEDVRLAAHGALVRDAEGVLGRFVDASWAYRFGPSAHDLLVASLEREGDVLAQALRFPAGRPTTRETARQLGLEVRVEPGEQPCLHVRSRRLVWSLRVDAPGFAPSDDAVSLEPACERAIALRATDGGAAFTGATLTALNLAGALRVGAEEARR